MTARLQREIAWVLLSAVLSLYLTAVSFYLGVALASPDAPAFARNFGTVWIAASAIALALLSALCFPYFRLALGRAPLRGLAPVWLIAFGLGVASIAISPVQLGEHNPGAAITLVVAGLALIAFLWRR